MLTQKPLQVNANYFCLPGLKQNAEMLKVIDVTDDLILRVTCEYFNTDTKLIGAKTRKHEIVLPRYIVFYLTFKYTRLNKSDIGRKYNRDHTSVIHALQSVDDWLDVDDVFKSHVNAIKNILAN